jgi:predicted O-linked N-acetylglucosamine transferase (SPINDLY family)
MELVDAALLAYEQARSIDPTRVDAVINMGNILYDAGRLDDAVEMFEAAVGAAPAGGAVQERALINLGNTWRRIGDAPKALAAYDQVLARHGYGGLKIKRATTIPVVATSRDHIGAIRYAFEMQLRALLESDIRVTDPLLEASSTNFFLAYHGLDDRRLQELTARLHLKSCPSLAEEAPHVARSRKNERLRVGFVSAFFRRHSVGRLMDGLIATLPREEFEVVVITQPGPRDEIARRIDRAAGRLIIVPEGLAPARDAIARAECDILVYADIGMDVRTYFLAFARLAPVQAVMWGHPDTTGIPNLDWFVSSELIETDSAAAHYSERLHRLPTLPTRYARPRLPERRAKADFGFDEARRLYLCPQSVIKHHPDLDLLIAHILRADGAGQMVLIEGAVRHWSDQVQARMRATIPDVVDRVRFVPRMGPEDFIALQGAADVIVDTLHFSGGNTSYESFALGKPVVTHAGAFMRGRVTLGQYRAMGLGDEFVGDSVEACAALAVRLGTDADYRRDAEARVAVASEALWDETAATEAFAAFLKFAAGR